MDKIVRVAAHALIKKGSKYLVTHRAETDDYMPGFWDIPGGTVEFGEDIIKALKRELKEEINIKVEIGEPFFAFNYLSSEYRHQFMIVYECIYIAGKPKLSQDHDQFRWVTLEEMGKLKIIKFLKALCKKGSGSRPNP